MHEKRLVRYRSVGLVDLGVGLGSPSPLVLKAADRLDLLLGDRIWPTRGRVGGLPYYGQAYPAGLPEHLGWGLSPDRLTRWIPALWPNPDGSPRELWAVRGGKIERLHVSHEGSWRFDSMGSARFPDPDATKGLGTVRMIPAPDSPFPHLLLVLRCTIKRNKIEWSHAATNASESDRRGTRDFGVDGECCHLRAAHGLSCAGGSGRC